MASIRHRVTLLADSGPCVTQALVNITTMSDQWASNLHNCSRSSSTVYV